MALNKKFEIIKKRIEKDTDKSPDIVFRSISFLDYDINIVFTESLVNKNTINDYIMSFFENRKLHNKDKYKNIFHLLKDNIPASKITDIKTYEDVFFNLFNGVTLIFIEGEEVALGIETRGVLNSNISTAQNETVLKGPKDAFTENYQINMGMIRRRLRSEKLWVKEAVLGKYSKTKVGILYIDGITSQKLVDHVYEKISNINVDGVKDSNCIIEAISGNRKNVFPTYFTTERPDLVTTELLEGKIAIMVDNSQLVLVIPALFTELFHSPEDRYQKVPNASYTRVIRIISFLVTLLTPAIYLAITTYNHEAIPSKLLINLSIQRDGVPFPTLVEMLLMIVTFEILKETDTRIPSVIGSSLSIVGALVLGEAAVSAGIVSPIMVIVVAITSISGFIISDVDTINGIRWWRLFFLIAAALGGIIGIVIVSVVLVINLSSIKTLGIPYLMSIAPLSKKDLGDTLILSNKKRFFKRKSFLTKNITKGKE